MDITINKEDALRTLAAAREEVLRYVEQAKNLTTAHAALYAEWLQHEPERSATHE